MAHTYPGFSLPPQPRRSGPTFRRRRVIRPLGWSIGKLQQRESMRTRPGRPTPKPAPPLPPAGGKEQRQLWAVNADGSKPRKLSQLKGYAACPRWSQDGKQIAFLYIEDADGGGPLMAGAPTPGGSG